MSPKTELLHRVRADLRQQLERLKAAAREAHAAATDPGSRAEGKYDTRSLEASYLAAGQARQVDELAAACERLEAFEARDFEISDAIECGAMVEADRDGETEWFLLLPAGGGHEVDHDGRTLTLLGPDSPLYRSLIGCTLGDLIDETGHMIMEVS